LNGGLITFFFGGYFRVRIKGRDAFFGGPSGQNLVRLPL